MLLFLVALGLLAIPASVQETWVGERVQTVVGFELLGEPRLLSGELLVTAGLLGGVCALYFTRAGAHRCGLPCRVPRRVVGDVEQIMAVHAANLVSPELRASSGSAATVIKP